MDTIGHRRISYVREAFVFLGLVYYTIVRQVRIESGNAAIGILAAVARILALVAVFYILLEVVGLRSAMIRGDSVLFLTGGILLFFMHNNAISRVLRAGSTVSPIMQHGPMSAPLLIISSTLTGLYLYVVSTVIIFTGLYIFRGGIEIYQPGGILLPFFLAWASGVVVGLIFLMVKPFTPRFMMVVSVMYQRANLITSGKFFVANILPAAMLPYFDWNPLFHSIDQMRGSLFVNYVPQKTTIAYPIGFVIVGLLIGLMGEFWLRKTISRSTGSTH